MANEIQATFLSYARADSDFALRLAKDLRESGAAIWLDQIDVRTGQRWDHAVEHALTSCACLIVILTPASVGSHNVMDEVSFALELGKHVIPVLYRDCQIPFRLRRVQYVDFRSAYGSQVCELLNALDVVGAIEAFSGVSPSLTPPAPPHGKPSLFPVYGITLGQSTRNDLAKIGTRSELVDKNTGKPYCSFKCNGVDFWYDAESSLVTMISFYEGDGDFPEQWDDVGFGWENSYDEWLALLEHLGYSVTVPEPPHIEPESDGSDSFCAKVTCHIAFPCPHAITLDFCLNSGTDTSSAATLYAMYIKLAE